jgi:alpha-D-ribose 1-methylphosphonate 5-triphosphate synthase subunit PhnH
MNTVAALKPYDQVFDGQKHYRTLLQATARPGTIGQLDDAALDVPPQLNRATALIAMALLSGDVTYYLDRAEARSEEFILRETAAKPAGPAQAEFLIFPDAQHFDSLNQASTGFLSYPDQGATVIVQAEAISPAPVAGGLRLQVTGPGVETRAEVSVRGVPPEIFELLHARNAEFPLGIDAFFTCDSLSAGPCVLALPRTAHVQWEQM